MPCTRRVIPAWQYARIAFFVFTVASAASAQISVITYHNDTYRTGWNSTETTLTPSNVTASQLGALATATVDDQVDAIPLVVANVNITSGSHQGTHDVVYVETAAGNLLGYDWRTGERKVSVSLGAGGGYSGFPVGLAYGSNELIVPDGYQLIALGGS